MKKFERICVLVLLLLPFARAAKVQAQNETLRSVCPSLSDPFFNLSRRWEGASTTVQPWKKDYPMVIFDAERGSLFWKEPNVTNLVPLGSRSFTPVTFTNEKVLYLVCKAHFGSTVSSSVGTVNIPSDSGDAAGPDAAPAEGGMRSPRIQPNKAACDTLTPAQKAAAADLQTLQQAIVAVTSAMSTQGMNPRATAPELAHLSESLLKAAAFDPNAVPERKSNPAEYNERVWNLSTVQQQYTSWSTRLNAVYGDASWKQLLAAAETLKEDTGAAAATDWTTGCTGGANRQNVATALSDYYTIRSYAKALNEGLNGLHDVLVNRLGLLQAWYAASSVDTVAMLDPVQTNALTTLTFFVKEPAQVDLDSVSPAPSSAPALTNVLVAQSSDLSRSKGSLAAPAGDAGGDSGSQAAAIALIERHRVVHFSGSSGLLVTRATDAAYSVQTLPTTTVTTTTVIGPTSADRSVTIATTDGTASYVFADKSGPFQQNAVAGVTWYLFGRDSFPVTSVRGGLVPVRTGTYASHLHRDMLGLFVGTSINSLGPLVVAPTVELTPGVQLFGGVVLRSSPRLDNGFIPCTGVGTSTTSGQTTGSIVSSPTGTITTTVTTQTQSNCANATATVLSGTTYPTRTELKPAFGFGILLNSNLLHYFTGFSK